MSEVRQKTEIVMVRVTPDERAEIAGRALASGVTTPEYLRRSALSRRINPQARLTAETLKQLARIGNNLNQIARETHIGRYNQEEALSALSDVRRIAASLVGKGGAEA
jgi:hypothetical protein